MLDAATQLDFYGGGGLDIAFLGFGEFDEQGSVNVSLLGGITVGPGGFIDIGQNAKKVVLYLTERGSFRLTTQGIELYEIAPGIDLQRDILDQMDFAPLVAKDLQVMDAAHFTAA